MYSFEEFVDKYGEKIDIELSENGADREMDFDREKEYLVRYDRYLMKDKCFDIYDWIDKYGEDLINDVSRINS
tara:strand:+ start:19 stop:237 length:219 start_codon:yes stop_codon:yes gene_type:complete